MVSASMRSCVQSSLRAALATGGLKFSGNGVARARVSRGDGGRGGDRGVVKEESVRETIEGGEEGERGEGTSLVMSAFF
jgi:hypothetical protein